MQESYGQGKYTWPDGKVYVGEWENGIKLGSGTYRWGKVDKFVGEFSKDLMSNGCLYKSNGNIGYLENNQIKWDSKAELNCKN